MTNTKRRLVVTLKKEEGDNIRNRQTEGFECIYTDLSIQSR